MSYTVSKYDGQIGFSAVKSDRTYAVKYIVESTTSNDMNIKAASAATGMPARGSAYEHDPGAFLENIQLDSRDVHDSGTTFVFTANYNSSVNYGAPPSVDNPLKEPPKVKFSRQRYAVTLEKAYATNEAGEITDTEGNPTLPVVTTAGTPFSDVPVVEKGNTLIDIQYNVRTFKPQWISEYCETVNLENMTICGMDVKAKCAKINDISAANNFDADGNEYYTVSVIIEISKTEMHKKSILNTSMMAININGELDDVYLYKKQDGETIVICKGEIDETTVIAPDEVKEWEDIIKEGRAEPVAEPQRLDVDGLLISDPEDDSYYSDFVYLFPKSWQTLNLPKRPSDR